MGGGKDLEKVGGGGTMSEYIVCKTLFSFKMSSDKGWVLENLTCNYRMYYFKVIYVPVEYRFSGCFFFNLLKETSFTV